MFYTVGSNIPSKCIPYSTLVWNEGIVYPDSKPYAMVNALWNLQGEF